MGNNLKSELLFEKKTTGSSQLVYNLVLAVFWWCIGTRGISCIDMISCSDNYLY